MKCTACGYHSMSSRESTTCKMCGKAIFAETKDGPADAIRRTTGRAQWQRHLLVRTGAPPLELIVDEPFTIGRASESTMSVPSPRVSRNHAEVHWKDRKPVLRDLGSENGTLVNGARITERALVDRDELAFGPYVCTYRAVSGLGSVEKRAQGDGGTTQPSVGDALTGRLAQLSLFELLTTLELHERSGQVVVTSDDRSGKITLDAGRIAHASVDKLAGEAALHELLRWHEGSFSYTKKVDGRTLENMPRGFTALMHEAARRAIDGEM
jgi:hypothetical protein